MPSTDSDPIEVSLALQGVWIHDPLDPQGTSYQFLYGRSTRSAAVEPMRGGTRYVGRTYPVYDFGEHEDHTVNVGVAIPNGSGWATQMAKVQAFSRMNRVLCLRENRGRQLFGVMTDYRESDQDWGTMVTFTFVRTEYDQAAA